MSDFDVRRTADGFTCKLWRGQRTTKLGFDVADPEPDLVGFPIELKSPGSSDFVQLRNRIAYAYSGGAAGAVLKALAGSTHG
ncbi:hypothetical protein, partial [Rhodoplanes sp. SY1]|uniref:hypothetical protein n=1 Tax=Rhodoplanes sp. SY1 TaxID=3166646 RepID=UPI0038B6A161